MNQNQSRIADLIIDHTPEGTGSPLSHISRFMPPETSKESVIAVINMLQRLNLIYFKKQIVTLSPKGIQVQKSGESVNTYMLRMKAQQAQNQSFLLRIALVVAILLAIYFWSKT